VGVFIGGVIGTFFSFVGLLLVYLNLKKQTEAISLQQEQININNSQVKKEQFETTFFQLLGIQSNIYNGIQIKYNDTLYLKDVTLVNSTFFNYCVERLKHFYKYLKIDDDNKVDKMPTNSDFEQHKLINIQISKKYSNIENPIIRAKVAYSILFELYHNQLGHYFRHLYHVLKFVHEKEKTDLLHMTIRDIMGYAERTKMILNGNDLEKRNIHEGYKYYTDLFQAQLSSNELLLLFYNGMRFPEMRRKIQSYDFLENLAVEDLIDPAHLEYYDSYTDDYGTIPKLELKSRENVIK
jgi:hypothetical protein